MDAVRKLILDRSVDQGRTLKELSLAIGRNHAYLQQFINRNVPKKLPEDVRKELATALAVPEDRLRGSAQTSVTNLSSINQSKAKTEPEPDTALHIIPGSELIGRQDLPVYATVQGGRGAIIVSSDPVEWVARPEPLARVKDGYGVIVSEDSMSPEFEPGDIALVHPHQTPTAGATCIFKCHLPDGTIKTVIKRLRRITADAWHVRQWNPPEGEKADYQLKRSEWQECHITVGRYSRR